MWAEEQFEAFKASYSELFDALVAEKKIDLRQRRFRQINLQANHPRVGIERVTQALLPSVVSLGEHPIRPPRAWNTSLHGKFADRVSERRLVNCGRQPSTKDLKPCSCSTTDEESSFSSMSSSTRI